MFPTLLACSCLCRFALKSRCSLEKFLTQCLLLPRWDSYEMLDGYHNWFKGR